MKQLLLRVPEDLHRKLALRAGREGRSMNALATEMLEALPDEEHADRAARLRAAAAAAGMLRLTPRSRVGPAQRKRSIEATKGLGAQVDRLLDEERERA